MKVEPYGQSPHYRLRPPMGRNPEQGRHRRPRRRIIFILGPTGAGKTEAGLKLAQLLPVEFICADSMQVYKKMDIVTDKPPAAVRKKHKHHLIDIIEPNEEYSVADFCRAARRSIAAALKRKKTPVVLGGTGLYVDSLLYGIFEEGSKDKAIREKFKVEAEEKGIDFVYEKLKKTDPKAARKINPNDVRRIIRALEVYETTRVPISALQKRRKGLLGDYDCLLFGLRRERRDLYERIDRRVDSMMNAGLLDEVRFLLKLNLSRTAYYCIGIRETEGYFKGAYGLPEAVRLIKRNSRRFAKRQMTWFNKNKDIEWLDLDKNDDMDGVAQRIYARMRQNQTD